MFQLARARSAGKVAGVENPGYLSSWRVMLSGSAFQYGRDVKPEPDEAVEQLLYRGPEMFIASDDENREGKAALDRGVQQAWRRGCPRSTRKILPEISLAIWMRSGGPCTGALQPR